MSDNFITSLYLSDRAAFERLQAVAVAAGCYQTRGPGAGSLGSVGALNQALADGTVIAVRAPVLAQAVDLLNQAYADMLPHEPGRAEVIAALRLLGHDPEREVEAQA